MYPTAFVSVVSLNLRQVYNVPDALSPEAPMEANFFFNSECMLPAIFASVHNHVHVDATARAALHAPTSKNWSSSVNYRFGGPGGQDPSK